MLASCYRKSLELAKEYSAKTIAFPAISTGAYGFPPERATNLAVEEVKHFLEANELPEKVYFVCFNEETRKALRAALAGKIQ